MILMDWGHLIATILVVGTILLIAAACAQTERWL